MKGGFLAALDRELFDRASAVLVAMGATASIDEQGDGVVQLCDATGRLFTLFQSVPLGTEWEVYEGAFSAAPGADLPDMEKVVACPFECRWPDLVSGVAGRVAGAASTPTWVLDGDGVVWNASEIDPMAVVL